MQDIIGFYFLVEMVLLEHIVILEPLISNIMYFKDKQMVFFLKLKPSMKLELIALISV